MAEQLGTGGEDGNVVPVKLQIGESVPEITGERDANPALASLLTALEAMGLIEDSTTEGGGG